MTATTSPKLLIRRRLGLVLLLALPLLAYTAVQYQQALARERAAELAAYCAEPATGAFALRLACIARRDQ
jgi:hypothetical protein